MSRPHLRLVEPIRVAQAASSRRGAPPSATRTTPHEDVEQPHADAAALLARELDRAVRREGPLPPDRALRAVLRVARAMANASARRRFVESRSHVLWLGAVLFYALTGEAPLAPTGAPPADAPRPSALAPHAIDPAVDALVQRCLASRPADRFASVAQLCEALASLSIAGTDAETPPADAPRADPEDEDDTPTVPPISGPRPCDRTADPSKGEAPLVQAG